MSGSQTRFDLANIRLSDTSKFELGTENGEHVHKDEYLKQIKTCRWFGPFKLGEYDHFCFFTLNSSGDNEYCVRIQIVFYMDAIQLYHCKNNSPIIPGIQF